ncbi:CD63 antigen-like [Ostrinia furnacalis]|uniref:CD63 antigen-like n=1 Tax=Ostrinia furnacalis TaxID=93504 RepID=UPI001038B179|nr:CD63 antigen-like [Ostrinia furnacalis]
MGCVINIVKYILFAVNSLYSILGIGTLAIGALVISQFDVSNKDELNYLSLWFIISGCFLFLIALFGCCGVITEKTYLLLVFTLFMTILLSAKIYVVVELRQSLIEEEVKDALNEIFSDPHSQESFYLMESLLKCCGTTGAESYEKLNMTLSITCCPLPESSEIELCSKENAYDGCVKAVMKLVNSISDAVFYAVLAVIIIESVGVIFASCLIYEICKKKKKLNYYQRS